MLLQPLLGLLISEEKPVSNANTRGAFNILLSSSVVFVAHVHNRGSFTPIRLLAENTNEVLLNFGRYSADCALLPWTVFSVACSFALHETRNLRQVNRSRDTRIRFWT